MADATELLACEGAMQLQLSAPKFLAAEGIETEDPFAPREILLSLLCRRFFEGLSARLGRDGTRS
jgi:hypothetical protein